jgi:DNA-binding CsgD family transcriptional regulator
MALTQEYGFRMQLAESRRLLVNRWRREEECVCGSLHLTGRQVQVIELASSGLTAQLIGRRLRISKRTVDDHLASARQRCGARSTEELIARCWAAGFFAVGSWPPIWSGRSCFASLAS